MVTFNFSYNIAIIIKIIYLMINNRSSLPKKIFTILIFLSILMICYFLCIFIYIEGFIQQTNNRDNNFNDFLNFNQTILDNSDNFFNEFEESESENKDIIDDKIEISELYSKIEELYQVNLVDSILTDIIP